MRTATVELYKDRKGDHRWRLRSPYNGKVIADCGEGYSSRAKAAKGFASVARYAPGAVEK